MGINVNDKTKKLLNGSTKKFMNVDYTLCENYFAKPNSNPDKGVVVHEEQELIIRKHFLHAFCFGKKI